MTVDFPKMSKLKTSELFQHRLNELKLNLPFDSELENGPDSPLAQPMNLDVGDNEIRIGNRFSILPMEGWDGTRDGTPTELTRRRWANFGRSGAKLIWGGEAVAVRPDGRANPNQLLINDRSTESIGQLRELLVETHQTEFGNTAGLSVGLQLTHSGRFARPNDKSKLEPRTVYQHSVLDQRFETNAEQAILSDDELKTLIDDFVAAAKLAAKIGFDWVDIKHCHGYLGHELLSGFDRKGEFGGSFENRTRFLKEIVAGIQSVCPDLGIGVRLSIFDFVPFEAGPEGHGVPAVAGRYKDAFGGDGTATGINLTEPIKFVELLRDLGIRLVCTTAGSPYYNPHIQRPAAFPPSDGYHPPEDPLVGVARQIEATARLKEQFPEMAIVGSGYSYLQDWLPNVAQAVVRNQLADSIGLGRMVLSYPYLPADAFRGNVIQRKRICRTFSDCTTAPRNGMISGCYPLDPFYKKREEFLQLRDLKRKQK